ncbi:MAG: hypothetical protein HWQ38_01285 [Nostoc sp. NMS7]|uniref:hypothetical protein n=1 Tax=Nostoc sp. NMS7 TaxID=2815391 RepID=UPI0025E156B5|nr:hypothetical protein [Nostoc sp. NMS7]MBN3945182.1 hypothetical protein [Nostoc sp. NMS7]
MAQAIVFDAVSWKRSPIKFIAKSDRCTETGMRCKGYVNFVLSRKSLLVHEILSQETSKQI